METAIIGNLILVVMVAIVYLFGRRYTRIRNRYIEEIINGDRRVSRIINNQVQERYEAEMRMMEIEREIHLATGISPELMGTFKKKKEPFEFIKEEEMKL